MFYIYRDVWTVNEEHYWVNENFPPLFRCRDYFKAQQEALCKLQLLSREIRNEVIAEYFPRAQYNLWYDWPPPNTNVKYFQKGNSKQAYSKKFRPSAEEDAAIKAFFAESPEIDKQKVQSPENIQYPQYLELLLTRILGRRAVLLPTSRPRHTQGKDGKPAPSRS